MFALEMNSNSIRTILVLIWGCDLIRGLISIFRLPTVEPEPSVRIAPPHKQHYGEGVIVANLCAMPAAFIRNFMG